MMKGILFKPDMIQAVIEDRKTQTRRLAGLKEINKEPDNWEYPIAAVRDCKPIKNGDWIFQHKHNLSLCVVARPRYNIGETVYIKEAWFQDPGGGLWYRLDNPLWENEPVTEKWKSPLFMPEKYARYFITTTDVKPQRIATITREEISAEGTPHNVAGKSSYRNDGYQRLEDFRLLWDSINKKNPFEKNEWVFAYTFKRLQDGQ